MKEIATGFCVVHSKVQTFNNQSLGKQRKSMENGVKRWAIDISKWVPSSEDFLSALSLLPRHEHSSITSCGASFLSLDLSRCVKMADRKRALVSRLLQYVLVNEVLGIPVHEIIIRRTVEGKPYLDSDCMDSNFPNFNFNVSHHGDLVAIASEPLCLVGLDIVCPTHPVQETIPSFLQKFSSYFSSSEWHKISTAGTGDQMLDEFYRFWSLKEAFIKAIGSGIGFRLDAVEFHHSNWSDVSARVDEKELTNWRFWHFELKQGHYATIARGYPRMASASYIKALKRIDFGEDEYNSALFLPNTSFEWLTVGQLISSIRHHTRIEFLQSSVL